MLTPEKIKQFNEITGYNVPLDGTPEVKSRADEIREIGQRAQQEIDKKKGNTKFSFLPGVKTTPNKVAEASKMIKNDPLHEYSENIANDYKDAGKKVVNDVQTATINNAPMHALHAVGDTAGAVFSPITNAIKPAVDYAADKISDDPTVQKSSLNGANSKILKAQDTLNEKIDELSQKHPESMHALKDIWNIAQLFIGEKAEPVITDAVKSGVDSVTTTLGNAADSAVTTIKKATTKAPEKVAAQSDAAIVDNFTRGVKPTVTGKSTSSQIGSYNTKVVDAVKTIVENKGALKLTDEFGDPTGKLPENPRQFGQAIEQAKQEIFNRYDSMTKRAGEKGATVDLLPVVDELNKVAKDSVTKDLHPELAQYATARAEALGQRGSYTAAEAQTAVQNLNRSLEAFYKNPSYETASRASIDAMIANNLREGLDKAITDMNGSGYAELKSKYGSLKTIEKDVNKRAQMEARKTAGGLSLGDVFSAEEVIRGLATMNPQAIATGAGVKAITSLWKYFNNPERYIKNMFEEAEKSTNTSGISSSSIGDQE